MDFKSTPTLPDVDPFNKPPRLIVCLTCNGAMLLCLIETGAEVNLMRQATAQKIGLHLQNLLKPTTINLAMENDATAPIILKYFVAAVPSQGPL
ncbi:hypothetical protein H4Q26_014725 [Puccinia striiformis f. sp. tritici PST-130]|nr:hypothetical protein H4Q26_014725 [Puccinia striiformis f. sp. tritici PST-130]